MEDRRQYGSLTRTPDYLGHVFETKGFTVLDPNGEKIGKVDDIYVGADREARYLGVKMGFLGTKTTVIPLQLVTRVDPDEKCVYLSVAKDVAKAGPVFDRDHQFGPQDEVAMWQYYGLGQPVYAATEIFLWEEAG